LHIRADADFGDVTLLSPFAIETSEHIIKALLSKYTGRIYWFGKRLKETIYGEVWHCVSIIRIRERIYQVSEPIQQYAIKIYSREKIQEINNRSNEKPLDEIGALQLLSKQHISHTNVIQIYECCSYSSLVM
jgi:hypothetical protein